MITKTCKGCGSDFAPRASGKPQVWCSRQCAYEHRCATVRAKTCSECGQRFETSMSHKSTCSLECQAVRKLRVKRGSYKSNDPRRQQVIAESSAARRRRKLISPEPVIMQCTICSASFVRRQWQQITCSPKCSGVHRMQRDAAWQRDRAAALRRRKAELRKRQRQALAQGVIERQCPWCGDDFEALDETERYCSEDCQTEDAIERHREGAR